MHGCPGLRYIPLQLPDLSLFAGGGEAAAVLALDAGVFTVRDGVGVFTVGPVVPT